jgi:DNA-directed RNA polymerase subunit K/omega
MELDSSKALKISLEEQLLIEKILRKFVEQQLEEKDKKIISLEKQLKEEKTIKNQDEKV